jgi:hypothetical protein
MCIEGQATIEALDSDSPDKQVMIQKGEAVLIPAILRDICIQPIDGECQLIEIHM